jgi:glycosyltransferase involved in cell wall biosynthesis
MKSTDLNICHVYATFLPVTSGGVEHHIICVSKFMDFLGHQSLLITPRYRYEGYPLPKTEDLGYLKVHRVGLISPPHINKRFIGPLLNLTVNRFDALLDAYGGIRKWSMDFDLIHIHSGSFSLDLGFRLSKWLRCPFIITFHQRHPVRALFEHQNIFEAAEKIVVHRDFTQHIFEKRGLGQKTVFIPMFISVEKYRRPHTPEFSNRDHIRILFIGRLEKRRDPLVLLHAFANVYKHHSDVELHIVGDGSLEKRIRSLARQYGLERNVFLHGKQLDVRKHLWLSDIYVSTNIIDDYPSLALREAMAAGLVIISIDVGEIRRIIHDGKNGLLVPPSDPIALSKAILTLIENEKMRKRLTANAQLSSQDFDIAEGIQQLIRIYNGVPRR